MMRRTKAAVLAASLLCGSALAQSVPDRASFEVVMEDGTTSPSVHLGQTFTLQGKVPADWWPPDEITVELSTSRGDTAPVTLTKTGTSGGYVQYAATGQSIGGERGGFNYDGTITGLDSLENGGYVTATLTGFAGSSPRSSNIVVYDNDIQHGIGLYRDALRRVSDGLARQKAAIRSLRRDPNMTAEVLRDLDAWERDVDRRLRYLAEGREVIRRANTPKAQLLAYRTTFTETVRNEVASVDERGFHMDAMSALSRAMREVIPDNMVRAAHAATLGTYMLVTELTLTRSAYTALSGQDTFGREVTGWERAFAVGELVIAYAMIRGLPRLVNWLAEHGHELTRPLSARAAPAPTGGARPTTGGGATPAQPTAPRAPARTPTSSGEYSPTTTLDDVRPPSAPPAPAEPYRPTTTLDDIRPPTGAPVEARPPTLGDPPTTIQEVLAKIQTINPGFPNIQGTTNNCQYCTDLVWRVLRGEPPRVATRGAGGRAWVRQGNEATATAPPEIPAARDWHAFTSRQGIEDLFGALPPLSHGRVIGYRDGSSHIFNVWKDATGRVWFIDGQTGRIAQFGGQNYTSFKLLLTDWSGARGPTTPVPTPAPAATGGAAAGPTGTPGGNATPPRTPAPPETGGGRSGPDVRPPILPAPSTGGTETGASSGNTTTGVSTGGELALMVPPIEFEIVPMSSNPPGETATGLDLADPSSLISFANTSPVVSIPGGRDDDVQLMIVDLEIGASAPEMILVPPGPSRGASLAPRSRGRVWSDGTPFGGARLLSASWSPPPAQSSGSATAVQMVFESLGASSGEAFIGRFASQGGEPLRILTEGLVVEPLKKEAQERLERELSSRLGKNPVTARLNAYCVEFLKEPPGPGMLFRVADGEIQQRFAPMRNILKASRKLRDLGLLSPDSDPAEYFHSIRQWAMWTEEHGFDVEAFGKHFVDRARKNFEASGNPWSSRVADVIRGLVPGRFADIQKVLDEATRAGSGG